MVSNHACEGELRGTEKSDGFRADYLPGLTPIRKMQFCSFRKHDLRSPTAERKSKKQMGQLAGAGQAGSLPYRGKTDSIRRMIRRGRTADRRRPARLARLIKLE